ncbi:MULTISPECIES: metallophosphoesterase family protein [unclassified Corynebacterium]|uniref:metallophosphoesterase family protein n=1 Tax=unclassified Corynebacterium TaxID=2624378 RepID=UPI000BAA5271|nr:MULTISPECIES: metallophosphoesterase [unclassified Corynebacterium]PAT04471.1 metallophosphoesterase [Corynebacterium sp. NML 150383]PAT15612.1 metallophosphoesterase [Corynebacterium sp. NML 120412]
MTAPILVLADIHLGRPQSGAKKTGPGIEWALEALQRGAQAGAAHFVMLGDVIDRSRFTSATFGEVTRFFARALELFDTTVFIAGNHDVHHDLSAVIPPGVAVAGTRPQTIRAGGWALHTAAVEVDRDPRRLVPSFPSRISGAPNLGLLHTSVTGEYSNNACLPCDVEELETRGYDAWALGHVHQRIELDAAVPVGWVGMGRGLIATLDDAHVTLRDL